MNKNQLKVSEYNAFYSRYLDLVPEETTLAEGFRNQAQEVIRFFESIAEDKLNYSYQEGKWTIKEVLQHLIDTERVFQFRCFHIARHDKTPIPGFEQDEYIKPSRANSKTIGLLIEEFKTVRDSFIVLLKSLADSDLKAIGIANGDNMSARAAAFIILGHYLWHIKVINERYL
ncbi:DinB family protein [Seonamhaeicola sp. ML3]|uniref:DinB family protein n=1 Tax=Seonamhaeicola sp. ML3 TaxID=2937786 RepID=UPI00200D1BB8|nr:DinB family protein [Seonamhaeicola sp. ML3]